MSQLLSVEEAAKRLAVTEAAIRKWVYQKRLPAVRVGRCLRLRLDDVERVASEGLE
jgi:excisionase family DNA binding protein